MGSTLYLPEIYLRSIGDHKPSAGTMPGRGHSPLSFDLSVPTAAKAPGQPSPPCYSTGPEVAAAAPALPPPC